jgi:glucosamine--fructose-6-phosphate aminotransferase (isomerizing)
MLVGSLMLKEALSAASAVAAQRSEAERHIIELAQRLAERPPTFALTVARGSSDHAAAYLGYLIMQRLGVPVASLPMSLITLHSVELAVNGQLAIALSQAGQSPDLVETMVALAGAGATTVALVNHADSPLARACETCVPLCAGEERSVAATKSYMAMLVAAARLVAHWRGDGRLVGACAALPDRLIEATHVDGSAALELLAPASRALIVGRGLGMTVALEAALKLKETSAIQAEAFSGAELRHGPLALVEAGYPVLIFALRGPEQAGLIALAQTLREAGARVVLAAPSDVPERTLTLCTSDDEALDPVVAIQSFYVMAAALAEARGLHPDTPRHLSKVTRTR